MSNLNGHETAFARIDEVVERAVEQGQAPGVVAAVARGEIVHVATAGVMAVGGAPMRRDTLFRISSTTKPMTAAAVLSLVDDGLLELNGPVDELLPELADRRVLRRPDGPLDQTVPAERSDHRPRPAHVHLGIWDAGCDVHGARAVADRHRGTGAAAVDLRAAAARSHARSGHVDGAAR